MRALPDQPHEKEYPREEWINQGQKPEEQDGVSEEDKEAKDREKLTKTRDEGRMTESPCVLYEFLLNSTIGQRILIQAVTMCKLGSQALGLERF